MSNHLLVQLKIKSFPNTRTDDDITDDVHREKHLGGEAGKGAGKWIRHKLRPEALDALDKFEGAARKWQRALTLPWEDSARLLPEGVRERYDAEAAEREAGFWPLVDAFGLNYPAEVEQARVMHNGTFDPKDYPDWRDCRKRFRFKIVRTPLPDSSHLNGQLRALYGADLDAAVQERLEGAMTDLWNRLLMPVQRMAASLARPKAAPVNTVRAQIENIRSIVQLAPALNFEKNPHIIQAARAIDEQLGSLDPELLTQHAGVRSEVARQCDDLAKRFGALGARKLVA